MWGDSPRPLDSAPVHLPVYALQIPTGVFAPVAGTAMDFTIAKAVGRDIASVDGGGEPGYDHCFCRGGDAGRPTAVTEIARLEVRSAWRQKC